MKTCVVIPAYDEAACIGSVVAAVKKYIADVIVIDDGSTDSTAKVARNNGAHVLSLRKNRGKGEALKAGFDYALANAYDAVLTIDGDGQHLAGDILNILENAAPPEVSIVVGNRMGNPGRMPAARLATNLFMSFIISVVCRQKIPDTQCGYRLIKCGILRKVRLISSKYEIESEMLIKASRLGFRIRSVPIKSVYEGQLSLIHPIVDTWRFFIMLCRMCF